MALDQRDYYRTTPTTPSAHSMFRGAGTLSITMWLIIVNVLCYLLDCVTTHRLIFPDGGQILVEPFYQWGAFTIGTAVMRLQLWRFITFQFLHASIMHITFNMFALFFFGPMMESYLGRWRFLAFYLLCGVAGPLSYVFFYFLHIASASRNSGLIGASAGVFGVLIAAAQVLPNATVLIYGILPVRLRTLAWVLLAIAIYTVFTNGHNAGGEAAHLGGAALGYLLIKNPRWLNALGPRARRSS
jgi:membrane associated rhomboid family serine protease